MANHQILYLDLSNVGVEDSRACTETLHHAICKSDRLLLCLDGIANLLKRPNGGTNKPLIRSLLSQSHVSAIGTMAHWEFIESILPDRAMQGFFSRIDVTEPDYISTGAIVQHAAARLSSDLSVAIPSAVVDRTVVLTSTFMLGESQPAKSIDVLQQICDDIEFERTQKGVSRNSVAVEDIVRVVSRRTGIAEETITGQGKAFDFTNALMGAIVGQDEAVREVSEELQLIAAGLTEQNKPASVMMFAGMSGVGKTELAKRIAELYSSSGRLQVYSMGNFTESHSVSGLIGVPPGYVGHEEGGRLVNDLIADPYSVFLFDEAEKCHPNVWKPFLNLFDEGWIVDQRGRKAYGDRAIFILTTNAGDRNISQLTVSGVSPIEIADQVRKSLSRVRQERSSQVVFPPQFLSRIKRIIVFRPLSEQAMAGIAKLLIAKMQTRWLHARQKTLEVGHEVADYVGHLAAVANESGDRQEGGRIIKKLINERIEHPILMLSLAQPEEYEHAKSIRVSLKTEVDGENQLCVGFGGQTLA